MLSAAVMGIPKTVVTVPGVIVPALVTAPVTVEFVITIEVVTLPAGFVTAATV